VEAEETTRGGNAKPLRLLVVEDMPRDAERVVCELRRGGFDVTWKRVDTAEAMRAALDAEPWDAIIAGYRMPHVDGVAALRILQSCGLDIPFIIVSGTINEETAVAAMKAGAHDYLIKDNLARLVPAIERELREAANRREHQACAEAVRALSFRQEAIRSAIPAIIMEVDSNKVYTWANQAGIDFFGKDVIGKEAAFYFEGEEAVSRTVQPLFAGDENIIHVKSWQRRKDGEKRLLLWVCRVLKDTNGKVTGAFSSAQDITDHTQLEAYREMGREVLQILNEPGAFPDALQRIITAFKTRTGFDAVGLRLQDGEDFPYFVQQGFSKDFLLTENTLIASGQDGGVLRNKDGSICLECTCGLVISGKTDPTNPLFTRGGSCWTNDSFTLLDLPSDQDPRRQPRNQCLHQGYASVALVPIRTQDKIVGLIQFNDRHKGRFTLDTVEILEGIATHIGAALMRKWAEAEHQKLQAQFTQAQKMESVGRLAGGVAHDFNNLIMGIMGYTDLCLDALPADHPVRRHLAEIAKISQRSADLTRQLLAFARKQIIAPKVLDLNNTLANMLDLLRRLLGENIRMIWVPGVNLWPIKLDPTQIDQILSNLCVNARDAISGAGTITVETANGSLDTAFCAVHAGAVPGEYVRLMISDTGCGMTKDVLANIFEPFFTTKTMDKGTGLGLATVYGIVKQNRGYIDVCSEPGNGTTFNIYLPRFVGDVATTTVVGTAGVPRGCGETILLVEDEPAVRKTVGLFLVDLGYTVLLAENPAKALDLATRHPGAFHLLLTDVIMPEMNGHQLAEQLQATRPGLKVLFMSGYTSDVIAPCGVLGEGIQFLPKPFTRDDLAHKLREVLDLEAGTACTHRLTLTHPDATAARMDPEIPIDGTVPVIRVLVVDDEEGVRFIIKQFLNLKGHTVLTAASGREALEIFRREPVDLVFTDCAIPDMNGDLIAAEIKRLSPKTPVIMLTGFHTVMDVQWENPGGVDYVLGKPVTPDQLQDAIVRVMRGEP
jgi:PAS domain S-box-containing protein